jgi:hypothetical protein
MELQLRRRTVLRAGALALGMPHAYSANAQAHKAGSLPAWRLLINEAVTGDSNIFLLTARYKPLADFVGAQFKGRSVSMEPVVDIERFVTLAQAPDKPELVFGKSVNQLAKLVRDHGYQPVVRRADPYKAAFIVAKDSPIKTLADAAKAELSIESRFDLAYNAAHFASPRCVASGRIPIQQPLRSLPDSPTYPRCPNADVARSGKVPRLAKPSRV